MLLAKEGRLEILDKMKSTLSNPRKNVKPHALKAEMIKVSSDRMSFIVGPRGEMKGYMETYYDVQIFLEDPDMVYVYGLDKYKVEACKQLIEDIAVIVKEGDEINVTVSSILDYGVIVTLNRAQQALLHLIGTVYIYIFYR